MAKKLLFMLGLAVLLALPVAVAELALRGLGLGNPIVYRTHAAFRYAPVPNQHVVRRGGARVTIDSAGLRGLRHWAYPADQRILFIGDSVTWAGTAIDDAATFAERACAKLRGTATTELACGNAGVNAYGTDNMTARLRYDPAVAQADTVVVTVISGDVERGLMDLQSNYFYSRRPHGPLRALWEATGYALFRISYAVRTSPTEHESYYDEEVGRHSLAALYTALRAVAEQGKRVLLVFSPYEAELGGPEAPRTRMVRASLRDSGLPVLDLTEAMRPLAARPLYTDGVHLTAEGHAFYGLWIAEALGTDKLPMPSTAR